MEVCGIFLTDKGITIVPPWCHSGKKNLSRNRYLVKVQVWRLGFFPFLSSLSSNRFLSHPNVSSRFSPLPLSLLFPSPPTTTTTSAVYLLSQQRWLSRQADPDAFRVSSEPIGARVAWQHLTQQLSEEHYSRWQEPELATQTSAAWLWAGAADSINCRQFAQD